MNSVYDEVMAALHSIWHRRWLALAVAWVVCLIGWVTVALIPNSYESKARIFVQLDDALAEQLDIGVGDRKRDIDRVRQTLTSAINLEKVIRGTALGDGITLPLRSVPTMDLVRPRSVPQSSSRMITSCDTSIRRRVR